MMRRHTVRDYDVISPWWCQLTVGNWNLKQGIEQNYVPRWTAAIFQSLARPAFQRSSQLRLLTGVISCWKEWRSDEGYVMLI